MAEAEPTEGAARRPVPCRDPRRHRRLRPVSALSLLLVSAVLLGGTAEAARAVTIGAVASQTESGQDFVFDFTGVPAAAGTSGTFTIRARGDYDLTNSTEFLSWSFASLGLSTDAGPSLGGATILLDNGLNDVEWTQSFAVSGADLLALTDPGAFSIGVDLNLTPDLLGVDCCFTGSEFVSVALSYEPIQGPIPEPTAGLLFLVGVGCVAWRTRRGGWLARGGARRIVCT